MSKYSPHYQLNQSLHSRELTRKLEKSKTHHQTFKLTNNHPYIPQMDNRSTDKKKRHLSPSQYQAPLLIEQNKMLLAENRQMALLIHQNAATIESLQAQVQMGSKLQVKMSQDMHAERQRLLNELAVNKKQADVHIMRQNKVITGLQGQNYSILNQFHIQRGKQMIQQQKCMHSQLQCLKQSYINNLSLLDTEKHKIKEQLSKKNNEHQAAVKQQTGRIDALMQECNELKQQVKQLENARSIQLQESKSFYETKMQNIHLDNRKDKQVFFFQYELQTGKLRHQLSKCQEKIQQLETHLSTKESQVQQSLNSQYQIQSKRCSQASSAIDMIRLQCQKDNQKQRNLCKSEWMCVEQSLQAQLRQLAEQNERLIRIIEVKNQQNQKMYVQNEAIRLNHTQQIQQSEKMFKQLQERLFVVAQEAEEENQAFKVKLSHLRQADLQALKRWYQNQMSVLNEGLYEKDAIMASNRAKYQQQLRQKIELRALFNIQILKYKNQISQNQSVIKTLTNQLKEAKDSQLRASNNASALSSDELKLKTKGQQLKSEQTKQLKAIIEAKDIQIKQLQSIIQLIKSNHEHQFTLFSVQIQNYKEKLELVNQEHIKSTTYFQNEITKYKEILMNEKRHSQQQRQQMQKSRISEMDVLIEQHMRQRAEFLRMNAQVNNANKQLNQDIQILKTKTDNMTQQLQLNEQTVRIQNQKMMEQLNKHSQEMQAFYLQKIKEKNLEIVDLQQIIAELGNDLRDSKQNYGHLQRKIEHLIEAQSELREMERKVMNLGKENSFASTMKRIRK